MRLKAITLMAATLLAGCTTNFADLRAAVVNPDRPVSFTMSRVDRAAVEAADVAALIMLNPDNGITGVGVAVQMREGRIFYNSQEHRGVVLDGGLIFGTLGLGTNLQAVTTQDNDPLVREAKPQDWDTAPITRTYHVTTRGPEFATITATCTAAVGSDRTLDVAEVNRRVTDIIESCETTDGFTFRNVHYVDAGTGRIWRSVQWTGPDQGNILIDIVEQFDPDA